VTDSKSLHLVKKSLTEEESVGIGTALVAEVTILIRFLVACLHHQTLRLALPKDIIPPKNILDARTASVFIVNHLIRTIAKPAVTTATLITRIPAH